MTLHPDPSQRGETPDSRTPGEHGTDAAGGADAPMKRRMRQLSLGDSESTPAPEPAPDSHVLDPEPDVEPALTSAQADDSSLEATKDAAAPPQPVLTPVQPPPPAPAAPPTATGGDSHSLKSAVKGPPMLPPPRPKRTISVDSAMRNKVKDSLNSLDVAPPEPKPLKQKARASEASSDTLVPLRPTATAAAQRRRRGIPRVVLLGSAALLTLLLLAGALQMLYRQSVARVTTMRPRYIAVPTGADWADLVIFEPPLQAQVLTQMHGALAVPGFLVGDDKTPLALTIALPEGGVTQWRMGDLSASADGRVWVRTGLAAAKVDATAIMAVRREIARLSPMSVESTGEVGSAAAPQRVERDVRSAMMLADERAFRSLLVTDPDFLQALLETPDAMHIAIQRNNFALAQWLYEHGFALDQAVKVGGDSLTPLELAIVLARLDWVRWLLVHGSSVEHSDADGPTLLAQSVSRDRLDAVKVLLSAGATPLAPDAPGITEVELALMRGNFEMAALLGWDGTVRDRIVPELNQRFLEYMLETALKEAHSSDSEPVATVAAGWREVMTRYEPEDDGGYHDYSRLLVKLATATSAAP